MVNWTTLDEECVDDECRLQPGDHPLVCHESSMAYSRAHLWREERILFALENGALEAFEPLSDAVLKRVVDAARASRELRAEWKAVLPES